MTRRRRNDDKDRGSFSFSRVPQTVIGRGVPSAAEQSQAVQPLVANHRTRSSLRIASALLLSFALFFPYFLEQLGSLRLFVVAIGFAALALEILLTDLSLRRRLAFLAGVGAYLVAAVGAIELVARQIDDRLFAVNAEHLLVMLPLFAFLAWVLYRSEQGRLYVVVLLAVATAVSLLAVSESLLSQSLFGREYEFATSQREGPTRALVGSENVLVLGAILATLVPLCLKLGRFRLQLIVSAVLVAGVWATGSRAPALICTAIAAVQLFPFLRALLVRFLWIVHALAVAALAGLAYLALFVWVPFIAGATGLEYSSNYRGAIYSLAPQFLADRPFGYLLQTPPAGRWLVDSELHGPVDIARSVDSEIVYAIFGLGWIGLAFFVAAVFVSIAAIKYDVAFGLSALTLTSLGFSLALHGWDAMSPLWYSLLGVCVGVAVLPVLRQRLRRDRQSGLSARDAGSGSESIGSSHAE
jgi:predicted phage tail protein